MDTKLYLGSLSKSTTQEELNTFFTQAEGVLAMEAIKDRKSSESKVFAFAAMSSHDEADKAISMFNAYTFEGNELNVSMARTSEQHIATHDHRTLGVWQVRKKRMNDQFKW